MVWRHEDAYFATLEMELEINGVDFRQTKTDVFFEIAESLKKPIVNDWKNKGKSKGNGFGFEITKLQLKGHN